MSNTIYIQPVSTAPTSSDKPLEFHHLLELRGGRVATETYVHKMYPPHTLYNPQVPNGSSRRVDIPNTIFRAVQCVAGHEGRFLAGLWRKPKEVHESWEETTGRNGRVKPL